MPKSLKISSGAERGELIIRQGHTSRLIESQPYHDDATTVFSFLENHLCHETFEALCNIAKIRYERKESFLDKMYLKHQKNFI